MHIMEIYKLQIRAFFPHENWLLNIYQHIIRHYANQLKSLCYFTSTLYEENIIISIL